MSKANSVGDYLGENILRDQFVVTGETITVTPPLHWMDNVSFQLITEDRPARLLTHDATDSVVASSGTWHFVNGEFTDADIGGTLTVANASNGGNNGAKVILTVVDATHVTTATTSLVNETFGVTVTASLLDLTLTAEWTVEASNNFVPPNFPLLNKKPNSGNWSPIANDAFSPAIEDVAAPSANGQFVQLAPFAGAFLRFILTPSAGAALLTITYCGKGTR